MKYFSNDDKYINAECEKCERVLQIPRGWCAVTSNGLSISHPVLCKCGTSYTMIHTLPDDYDHQYVPKKVLVSNNLIALSPEQILAKSLIIEFAGSLHMRDWEDSNLDANLQWRSETLHKIVEIGEPAVEPLIELLKDYDWAVRDDAALMLGRIQNIRAIQPLITAMQTDENVTVRSTAASALKHINTQESRNAVHAWYQHIDRLEKDQEVQNKISERRLDDRPDKQFPLFPPDKTDQ